MKRISLVLYLGLLMASLVLAYLTWVQEPKKAGSRVPVFRCKKGEIRKITYETKDQTVRFSKKKNPYSGESSWWVEIAQIPAVPEEADLEEETASGVAPVIDVFKANKRLEEGLGGFCPWKALRSLGELGGEKRKEFGLAEPAESLILELASGVRRFQVGAATFGPKDRYVADDETGEVFLVAGQGLRDLLRPKSRFMERALHTFQAKEVARVKLRAGPREKELVRPVSEENKEQGWADSRSPEETKDLYRNWIRKLFALRPTDYVRPPEGQEAGGCVPPPGSAQELRLTFHSRKKEIGFLILYRGVDENGDATHFACSEHSETAVKIPKAQAETLLADLEDVLSD
jgi:hypothetical protein